jgi:hypothetical protein
MKTLLISLGVLFATYVGDVIPVGTILPVQLNSTLDSRKMKPGQPITARVMQDVPLPAGRKVPAGAKLLGHVVSTASGPAGGARLTLQFDSVKFNHRSLAVNTNLRALASMMEVEYAQLPLVGSDRGTPWAWSNTRQIGGEIAYGQGGAVYHGGEKVGYSPAGGGALVIPRSAPGNRCPEEAPANQRPQALWLFSSDACGLYGFSHTLAIAHDGRAAPHGQIVLESHKGPVKVSGGSGMLLRVTDE